jgi:hypothetical protein
MHRHVHGRKLDIANSISTYTEHTVHGKEIKIKIKITIEMSLVL